MSSQWLTVVHHCNNCCRSNNAYVSVLPRTNSRTLEASALQISGAYPRVGVLASLFGKSTHGSQHRLQNLEMISEQRQNRSYQLISEMIPEKSLNLYKNYINMGFNETIYCMP